ncbi:hypothetical protein FHL06_10065 [Lactobacillus halodurans]|uniref:Uncharacterized protein n=1 Tax=Companilactobacillus halodurans TaxID=2584183 RepID=A0A5P0ZR22_9LACO|nr:hypothetical protein [Companilactobacillus halodurans]MQS76714.1 hypothetical protein [Companilactobacillus halodurans]
MNIRQFEDTIIHQKINKLSGIKGSIKMNNSFVQDYYESFIEWLSNYHVIKIVNSTKKRPISLKNVTSYDFTLWLFLTGNVYGRIINLNSIDNNKIQLDDISLNYIHNLGIKHPIFSWVVSITYWMNTSNIFSDKSKSELKAILQQIHNESENKNININRNRIALYKSLSLLSGMANEREKSSY